MPLSGNGLDGAHARTTMAKKLSKPFSSMYSGATQNALGNRRAMHGTPSGDSAIVLNSIPSTAQVAMSPMHGALPSRASEPNLVASLIADHLMPSQVREATFRERSKRRARHRMRTMGMSTRGMSISSIAAYHAMDSAIVTTASHSHRLHHEPSLLRLD